MSLPRPALAATVLIALMIGSPARAQDLDDPELPNAAQAQGLNGFVLSDNNFEAWIYGNMMGRSGSGADRLTALLTMNLDDVDRACQLSEPQRIKLRMAGQGDIKHFQDRVAVARRFFDMYKTDQNRLGEIHQETIPLSTLLNNGMFGEASLFGKTIRSTLTTEQVERYRSNLRDRDAFRYRAKIEGALQTLEASVRLTEEEHRRLVALILESTTPPGKWSGMQNDIRVVLIKIGQVPEDKLRAVMDEARWKALRRIIEQVRPMAQFLRAQGFLDDPKPAAAAAEAPKR